MTTKTPFRCGWCKALTHAGQLCPICQAEALRLNAGYLPPPPGVTAHITYDV